MPIDSQLKFCILPAGALYVPQDKPAENKVTSGSSHVHAAVSQAKASDTITLPQEFVMSESDIYISVSHPKLK